MKRFEYIGSDGKPKRLDLTNPVTVDLIKAMAEQSRSNLSRAEMEVICKVTTMSMDRLASILKNMAGWNRLSLGDAMTMISHGIPLGRVLGIEKIKELQLGSLVIPYSDGIDALRAIARDWWIINSVPNNLDEDQAETMPTAGKFED